MTVFQLLVVVLLLVIISRLDGGDRPGGGYQPRSRRKGEPEPTPPNCSGSGLKPPRR